MGELVMHNKKNHRDNSTVNILSALSMCFRFLPFALFHTPIPYETHFLSMHAVLYLLEYYANEILHLELLFLVSFIQYNYFTQSITYIIIPFCYYVVFLSMICHFFPLFLILYVYLGLWMAINLICLKEWPKSGIAGFSFSTYFQFFSSKIFYSLTSSSELWSLPKTGQHWISLSLNVSVCRDSWISSRYNLNLHIFDDYQCQANFLVIVIIPYTLGEVFFSNICICGRYLSGRACQ